MANYDEILHVRSAGIARAGHKLRSCAVSFATLFTTAIIRAQPAIEEYVGQHLRYPEPFLFTLIDTIAALQELRDVHVTARWSGDYPPVDVVITAQVLLTAKTRRRDEELGLRTFVADVEVRAFGAVQGTGYTLVPEEARLTAWWVMRHRASLCR